MTPEDEEKQAEENAAPAGGEQAEASAAAPAPGDKPEGDAAAAENKNADAASDAPAAEATGAEPAGETPKDDEEDDSRPKPPTGSVADLLAAALPDVTMSAYQGMSNVIVEIDPGDVIQVMTAAKEQPTLDLDFLRYLCGVDYEAEGLEVVFTQRTGDFTFTNGTISEGGTVTTLVTDANGQVELTFVANSPGPALIEATSPDAPLLAFSFFSVVAAP